MLGFVSCFTIFFALLTKVFYREQVYIMIQHVAKKAMNLIQ